MQEKPKKKKKIVIVLITIIVLLLLGVSLLVFKVIDYYKKDDIQETTSAKYKETLNNIPLEVTYNEEKYVIEGLPKEVSITFEGKKSKVKEIMEQENKVELDLKDYPASNTPVRVKLTYYSKNIDKLDYKIEPSYVTVTIKKKVSDTKTISYDLLNQDSLNPKLSVKSVSLTKTEVVVRGAQDTLDKIEIIKALINLDNEELTNAGTYTLENIHLVAYDSNGQTVENVEIVAPNLSAKIELDSYSKKVPIKVITTGDLVDGKAIASIVINNQEASSFETTIYGEESILKDITSLLVTIDVNGQGNNSAKTFIVTLSKPAGVRSISEESITVVLNFGDAKQKTITLNGVKTRNVPNGLSANLVSEREKYVDVQVIGVESVLDELSQEYSGIEAYVDLTGRSAGTYSVPVSVEGNDARLKFIVTKNINIVIS